MTLAQRYPIPDLVNRLRELRNRKRPKAEDTNLTKETIVKKIQETFEENSPHQSVEKDSTDNLFCNRNTMQIELRGD